MKMNQTEMNDILILHLSTVPIVIKSQSPDLIQTRIIDFEMIMKVANPYDSEKNATISLFLLRC